MTQQEAEQKSNELTELLKTKYKDIKAHVDLIAGTDNINISLFWNRKSREHYHDSKSFRIESSEYDKLLREEISKLL
jgi:hypothetical protein